MVPSVQVAKKLADTFAVTLDYLVDDTGNAAEIKDKAMLQRIIKIEALEQEDKKNIVQVSDSLLRVRAKINSQILSVAAPAGQGAKAQAYQAYSELSQHRQAGCIGA
jgi:hypothetical protein